YMSSALIDFAELSARVEDDRELMRDLLLIFKEEFPRHLQTLRLAVDSLDGEKVAAEAHTLKGMLSNLAAGPAAGAAARLEQLGPANGPRLALLDWVMPELDGPGVCREVRKRKERSYVYMVLLTSKESKEDVVAGLESGADDYLTKPFDPEELKARLRTGLR